MKTRIILESEVVEPFEEVRVKPATIRHAPRARRFSGGQLDCPPNGDNVDRSFRPKITFKAVSNRGSVPQHILLVEDESYLRDIYTRVLHGLGHLVDAAEDGEAGWDALCATGLDSGTYDLLIADNEIPKLSGVELVQKVRSANLGVPVILLAGATLANVEALHLSAILMMPFSQQRLAQAVQEVFRVVKNE